MLCVVCPHCHQMMTAPVDAVGESVACPSCKKSLQVPPNAPHLPKHLQPGGSAGLPAAAHAKAAAGGGGVAVAAPPVPGAPPGLATTSAGTRSTLPIGILIGAAVLGVVVVGAALIIPKLGGKKSQVISSTKKTPVIPSGDPTPPEVIPASDLTAAALFKAYFDNAIAADENYKDKSVTISGKVAAVGGQGELFVNLYGIDKARDLTKIVRCYFPDTQKDRLKALVPNQVIHVKGMCKGMTDGRVVIRDCNFVAE
jgi:hypothetical protein